MKRDTNMSITLSALNNFVGRHPLPGTAGVLTITAAACIAMNVDTLPPNSIVVFGTKSDTLLLAVHTAADGEATLLKAYARRGKMFATAKYRPKTQRIHQITPQDMHNLVTRRIPNPAVKTK